MQTMLSDILTHLGPIGQFLVGITGALTAGVGALIWIYRWVRSAKRELIEATTGCMQKIIRATMEREASKREPHEFYTLDIEFEGGHHMAVPMFPGLRVLVSENISMAVQDHNHEYTELGLWCNGFGALTKHRHTDTCERIHVERGTVTCFETGVIYRAGETWVIEPGAWHSAIFADCYCRIIHRPPLPTAAVRPVDLESMPKVFPP